MPIDSSLVPALEEELAQAKQSKAGGQPPRPERVAAIEAAIRLHKGEKPVKVTKASKETATETAAESGMERAAE